MCIIASGQLQCLNFRHQMAELKLPLALGTCCKEEIQRPKIEGNTVDFVSVDLGLTCVLINLGLNAMQTIWCTACHSPDRVL